MLYIFDFDGVIKDSVKVKGEVFKELYNNNKIISEKVFNDHLKNGGMPRIEKFKRWELMFYGKELSYEREKYLSNNFEKKVINKIIKSEYIPGFLRFYESIKSKDKYICTAVPELEAKKIINELNLKFDGIYGFPRSKIDIINYIKNYKNKSKKKIIYFGDSDSDLNACIKTKTSMIPINYTGSNINILKKLTFNDVMNYGL